MTELSFTPIKEFIKAYRTRAEAIVDDPNYSSPMLFVWESFQFCNCSENDCGYIDESELDDHIDTLKTHIHSIAVRPRRLKQRDYNDRAVYYVNDYYFTLKQDPTIVFALYTNILLSKWFYGKWHRKVKSVRSKLVCIGSQPITSEYIIPDVWKDYTVGGGTSDVYYDRSTLEFPDAIIRQEDCTDTVAGEVEEALSFAWPVYLSSRSVY